MLRHHLAGTIVKRYNIKVNYTRKLMHFLVIFTPFALSPHFSYEKNIFTTIVSSLIAIVILILFSQRIREKSSLLEIMFSCFDRPEDRPNTLKWFVTQYVVASIVLIPISYYCKHVNKESLILIPILINGIGDGLAEPVGIAFGKHAYKTKAIFSSKEYKRTIEGSLVVFLSSFIVLLFFRHHLTSLQLIICCMLIPIVVTMVEAKAPHTWDAPFIFLSSGLLIVIITTIVQ